MKPPENERLVTVRKLRTETGNGYAVNFYIGNRHVAWHRSHNRSVVVVGKVIHGWLEDGAIPAERSGLRAGSEELMRAEGNEFKQVCKECGK